MDLFKILKNNAYPGRGIVIGRSDCGNYAVFAYFTMGRSENSRNRIFAAKGDGIETKAFDDSKLTDPSLVIYNPVRTLKSYTIVTNGDQTETIYDCLCAGKTFEDALRTREFEPDPPLYTPRISGFLDINNGSFSYKLSILKSTYGDGISCSRFFYEYESKAGAGHFIHTYKQDGDPPPSFEGEPADIEIRGGVADFSNEIWESLNFDNKVSLFVRFIDLKSGAFESRIFNKNE